MMRLRYRQNCHALVKPQWHEWWICTRLDIQYCKRCGVLSEYRAEQVK